MSLLAVLLVLLLPLAAGFLVWAHVAYWSARLAPTGRPDELHFVRTADGWRLAVRRYRPAGPRRYAEPVILWHGLGVNHFNLDWDPPYGLAQYLASRGHDCFVPSLRGHGESDRPGPRSALRWGFSFDDHRNLDVPAVLAHVRAVTGAPRVLWVGHSMGGILAYSLGGTEQEAAIAGLVAIGSPSSYADQPYLQRLTWLGVRLSRVGGRVPQRLATRILAPFAGYFEPPFSELVVARRTMDGSLVRRFNAHAFENISHGVALQFADWVRGDHFRSLDHSLDYLEAMRRFRAPVLLVGGSADMMAPPGCMRKALARLGSDDKTLVLFGRDEGRRLDYGHGDLLLGRTAPDEVFPAVAAWLAAHATAVLAGERSEGPALSGGAMTGGGAVTALEENLASEAGDGVGSASR